MKSYSNSLYQWVVGENTTYAKPQHLYFTSDEEIKEGDWFLDEYSNIRKSSIETRCQGDKKIVACTNPDLWHTYANVLVRDYDPSKLLAKIPDSYTQAHISDYNADTPIKEVMLEYDDPKLNFCDCYYTKFCKSTMLEEGVYCRDMKYPELIDELRAEIAHLELEKQFDKMAIVISIVSRLLKLQRAFQPTSPTPKEQKNEAVKVLREADAYLSEVRYEQGKPIYWNSICAQSILHKQIKGALISQSSSHERERLIEVIKSLKEIIEVYKKIIDGLRVTIDNYLKLK